MSVDDLSCALCLRLFFEPVSTACGHTFCKVCIMRALHMQRRCPVCRLPCLLSVTSPPVNVVIQSMIERQFPLEYEARREEMRAEMDELRRNRVVHEVPLLVLLDALYAPGMFIHLRLLEPRYIEMAREATQSDRTFSILCISGGTAYGVLCEIRDIALEPHTRHTLLTVFAQKRFTCTSVHEPDSEAIPIQQVDDRVLKGQRLVYCLPEVLVDIPDDDELGEQVMDCKAFLRESLKKVSPGTQRHLRDIYTHEMDDTMSLFLQLAIPRDRAFEALRSVNRGERVMQLHQWIQGRKPSARALRISEGEISLNSPKNSLLFIFALLGVILLAWLVRKS